MRPCPAPSPCRIVEHVLVIRSVHRARGARQKGWSGGARPGARLMPGLSPLLLKVRLRTAYGGIASSCVVTALIGAVSAHDHYSVVLEGAAGRPRRGRM